SLKKFPARGLSISIMNTLMGLPPVVVGLFVYIMLSRSGPIGFMGLLYTPSAMIIAQTILAFPIVVSLCHSAIVSVDPITKQASMALGATPLQILVTIIKEARYGIMSGIIAAFGRVMAEVGAILIVGGNIAGYTRVMTTTIALETDKGNFELAIALGIILLTISLTINSALHFVQRKGALPINR
ncbi:MAG: ABC transporter permease, partial [Thermodesulfovibrionales bacterium]|nr:ABC transporter permease [Thermodesulfovibrionales bacterium]